jgi:hypothetical protein
MDRYVLKIIQIRALLILGLTFGISAGFGLWSEPQYIAYAEPIMEDTEWDDVTVELKSVKRASGDTITLKFKYTNTGSEDVDISRGGQYGHDNVIEHVYYVDTKNNKKYLIVKDSEGEPLGTKLHYFVLPAGKSKSAWAKFPAPSDDVETIAIYLPGAPPIEDVKIAQ